MSPVQATLDSWRNLTRQKQLNCRTTTNENEIIQQPMHTNQESRTIPLLIQQSIVPTTTINSNTFWGHQLTAKATGSFRLGLRNINSLPVYGNHSKNEFFIRDIQNGEFDIFCATEINVAWHNIPSAEQPAS
jgi:hypothetical protein